MTRLIALALLTPAAAYAHAGDHSGEGIAHALSSADHFAAIALLTGIVGLLAWAAARR